MLGRWVPVGNADDRPNCGTGAGGFQPGNDCARGGRKSAPARAVSGSTVDPHLVAQLRELHERAAHVSPQAITEAMRSVNRLRKDGVIALAETLGLPRPKTKYAGVAAIEQHLRDAQSAGEKGIDLLEPDEWTPVGADRGPDPVERLRRIYGGEGSLAERQSRLYDAYEGMSAAEREKVHEHYGEVGHGGELTDRIAAEELYHLAPAAVAAGEPSEAPDPVEDWVIPRKKGRVPDAVYRVRAAYLMAYRRDEDPAPYIDQIVSGLDKKALDQLETRYGASDAATLAKRVGKDTLTVDEAKWGLTTGEDGLLKSLPGATGRKKSAAAERVTKKAAAAPPLAPKRTPMSERQWLEHLWDLTEEGASVYTVGKGSAAFAQPTTDSHTFGRTLDAALKTAAKDLSRDQVLSLARAFGIHYAKDSAAALRAIEERILSRRSRALAGDKRAQSLNARGFNKDQARVPEGSAGGGRWTKVGGSAASEVGDDYLDDGPSPSHSKGLAGAEEPSHDPDYDVDPAHLSDDPVEQRQLGRLQRLGKKLEGWTAAARREVGTALDHLTEKAHEAFKGADRYFRYGEFCGPGPKLRFGACDRLNDGGSMPKPRNAVDAACQQHDIDYCHAKVRWDAGVPGSPATTRESLAADERLRRRLKEVGPGLPLGQKVAAKVIGAYFGLHGLLSRPHDRPTANEEGWEPIEGDDR